MTDEILGYIYDHFKLTTQEEKNAFLLKLKHMAKELWGAYRNGSVNYDYDKELAQTVYLLRYYLPYTKPIGEILKQLKTNELALCIEPLSTLTDLDIAFFGAGPAPELYGFLDYTHNNNWSAKTITAHLFDEKKWTIARKIAKEKILPKILNRMDRKFNRDLLIADWWMAFDSPGIPEGWEFIPKCKLAWFQNCFNESTIEDIVFFICNIGQQIGSRSLIILIDISRTQNDRIRFDTILSKMLCQTIDWNGFNIEVPELTYIKQGTLCLSNDDLNSSLSLDLKNKLFYVKQWATDETSGLILSNDYQYNYAIFFKE